MNMMERKPLPDGTKLVCNSGETYIIRGEPIGAGGYSIVYSAKKEGSASYFAIKECYPVDSMYVTSHRFYRDNGVVKSLTEQGAKYLKQLALRMNEEKEYSQIIFNYSICVVKMLEQLQVGQIYIGEEVYGGEEGIFFSYG